MLSDSQLAEAPRAWLIDGAADLLESRGWDASRRQAVDGEMRFAAALLDLTLRPILAQPAAC